MSSMDFSIGIEDVGIAVLQEFWNRIALQAVELVCETRDVVVGKDSFQEFSRSINELSTLLRALDTKKIEVAMGLEFTKAALEVLHDQLREAHRIVKDYKSRSRLSLILQSNSVLSQMQRVAREIATTISSFQLVNLEMALDLKTTTNQIVDSLRSMEFHSAVATETIAIELEKSMLMNNRNQANALKLLGKIAKEVGVSTNVSLVQSELELLKKEKEEMEAEKKRAEALQLTQLIQLLSSTELVTRPQDEEIPTYHQRYPVESLICPLCNELMGYPVAIVCGHSFERKAILEYFKRGGKSCPTCGQELPTLDLMPNISLQRSIEEWKQRDLDLKFQTAVAKINSDDHSSQNRALDDMQNILEMPQYAEKIDKERTIPKLVDFLKDTRLNTKATLKCLYYLAKYSDNHKEAIVEAGSVRRILKKIYAGETEPAITVLLELSKRETLAGKIGKTKDFIPVMVSLLHNDNPTVSQKAHDVLHNLSSNTHFAVKMAEAGYFQPFITCFNQGSQETRALMAAAFINMRLNKNNIKTLKDRQFIQNIIQMLSSNSPACKSSCLKCIKKLIGYPKMVKRLLSEPATIPLLLGFISFFRSDPHLKQEAAEILALMVGACQHRQFQSYQGLQELQSKHNVSLFLQHIANSEHQIKIQFLHLLVELSYKSENARNLIQSNIDAITLLFSFLYSDKPVVRRWAMKLIQCIYESNPNRVPLPPSPGKETAINNLAAIFICSPDTEERSIAAAIIGRLPKDDNVVDEVLCKSQLLKAIHEVLCSIDDEHDGIRTPACQDTSVLDNTLAALLHFTDPKKPEFQRQVGKLELYPSLIRVLSTGSSIAKKRTAIALAQLSQSSSQSVSNATIIANQERRFIPMLHVMKLLPNMSWCCSALSENQSLCSVHGTACSPRETFCLVKADAVKPLVQTLSDMESGVAEAALTALETLLIDHSTLSLATAVIVDSQGVMAILQVLEKGSPSAKTKALDLFQEILKYTQISDSLSQRSERILVQLLSDDALKKKVALVLMQMNVIPHQSSYF